MIPIELQDGLEERMKKLFEIENFRLKNPDGNYVALNIFSQHLPEKTANDLSLYPYLVIRLVEGEQNDPGEAQQVQVLFIVGVFDDHNSYQGYRDVVNVLQKIYENLKRNPTVNDRFELQYPIRWALHDEDVYPFYFGGIETRWKTPTPIREDVEAMI